MKEYAQRGQDSKSCVCLVSGICFLLRNHRNYQWHSQGLDWSCKISRKVACNGEGLYRAQQLALGNL